MVTVDTEAALLGASADIKRYPPEKGELRKGVSRIPGHIKAQKTECPC